MDRTSLVPNPCLDGLTVTFTTYLFTMSKYGNGCTFQAVLTGFANEIDLSGMQVDVALRKFQTYFRYHPLTNLHVMMYRTILHIFSYESFTDGDCNNLF